MQNNNTFRLLTIVNTVLIVALLILVSYFTYKLVIYPNKLLKSSRKQNAVSKIESRDNARKATVKALINSINIYKVENGKCPLSLEDMATAEKTKTYSDPLTKKPYLYSTENAKCIVSATLELSNDKDLANDYNPTNSPVYELAI